MTRAGVLVVIPARGGSKSIPRKNVRMLGGHPLLAWSIAAARTASSVARVLVSTDDPSIRDAALDYGAECPFRRPARLAADDTPDLPVFLHALAWLERQESYRPRLVVQLRPTSPLRPRGLVDDAVRRLLDDTGADSLRAVTPAGQTPFKMWTFAPTGRLRPLLVPSSAFRVASSQPDPTRHSSPGARDATRPPRGVGRGTWNPELGTRNPNEVSREPWNMPRQALPDVYWQTGHIDVIPRRTLIERRSMTGAAVAGLVIDPRYGVDIDTEHQWRYGEWLLEHGDLDVVSPDEVGTTRELGIRDPLIAGR